ncbi:MAG: polyphenol oxidase family protein [Deltaproteobacteria bacterium]|jgi:copper oxidase (laccase) domain-containing protein|nr:polyphenol oxidase family protein [Deltaproteobacteria bacterium]
MQRHANPGRPPFWTFRLLEPFHPRLSHGVFTREGPEGDRFNLSFEHGETGEVLKNLASAEEALGLPSASFLNQAHGDGILVLKRGESYAPRSPSETREGYDAMIGSAGQTLMVKLADCQGIILFSPETEALAVVHSGWRGSALDIAGKALTALRDQRGADPARTLCCVSPSIGPCCMEFKGWRELLPEALWRYREPSGDRFDFWAATRDQLLAAGARPGNIELSGVCTRCSGEFFSHRRGDLGRFAVMAGVRDA